MKKHNKKVILVGKGGAGKDFLASHLVKKGYVKDISYTTRVARDTEKNGIDYHFISKSTFLRLIQEGFFYETAEFNGALYGTSKESWEKADLFIMTPTGLSHVTMKDRVNATIVFLNIDRDTRRVRLRKRTSTFDTVERRLEADDSDFESFEKNMGYDISITDPIFDLDKEENTISFTRRIQFLEHIPNLLLVMFAISFYICLGFMFDEYIRGNGLLTVFCFVFPALMICAALYQWYREVKDA